MTDIKPKILKNKADEPEIEVSEMNLTNSEHRVDEILGKSAKICADAFKYSVDDTDMDVACTLFDYEPLKKFMIFDENGRHRLTVKTYKTAVECLNKGECIIYFSGH